MSEIRDREFFSIYSLTGKCAAQNQKNVCSSSLWTCLHHMVILRSQNNITDFCYDFSLIESLLYKANREIVSATGPLPIFLKLSYCYDVNFFIKLHKVLIIFQLSTFRDNLLF